MKVLFVYHWANWLVSCKWMNKNLHDDFKITSLELPTNKRLHYVKKHMLYEVRPLLVESMNYKYLLYSVASTQTINFTNDFSYVYSDCILLFAFLANYPYLIQLPIKLVFHIGSPSILFLPQSHLVKSSLFFLSAGPIALYNGDTHLSFIT